MAPEEEKKVNLSKLTEEELDKKALACAFLMGYSLYDVLSHGDLQKDPEFSNALVWTQKIKDA